LFVTPGNELSQIHLRLNDQHGTPLLLEFQAQADHLPTLTQDSSLSFPMAGTSEH